MPIAYYADISSGLAVAEAPEWNRLVVDATIGEIDTVVVTEASRFGRDHQARIRIKLLVETGVEVIVVSWQPPSPHLVPKGDARRTP